jgi:hypothetical protein
VQAFSHGRLRAARGSDWRPVHPLGGDTMIAARPGTLLALGEGAECPQKASQHLWGCCKVRHWHSDAITVVGWPERCSWSDWQPAAT